MMSRLVLSVVAATALLLSSTGFGREPWLDYVWLVKVKPGGKRFIFSHGVARPGCTEAEPCPTKAYVVAGNILIASEFGTLGRGTTKWVEVEYVSPSGKPTFGWLRDTDLEPLSDPPTTSRSWTGHWVRQDNNIFMKRGRGANTIAVEGEAIWGASDPDRVRRGGVHFGEIEGEFRPSRSAGGFTMGETGTLAYDKGGEYDCRVRFRLMGPYLLAEDNSNCGGVNATFLGAYAREGR